jgi:CrcB protein
LAAYPWFAAYALVALGGALGSVARFWLGDVMAAVVGARFPWGTLLINVLGSFVIGWFDAFSGAGGRLAVPADVRAFVMVGICGGFTTFSAFSLQTLQLLQGGEAVRAGAYIAGSVVLCLLAVWAGVEVGRP